MKKLLCFFLLFCSIAQAQLFSDSFDSAPLGTPANWTLPQGAFFSVAAPGLNGTPQSLRAQMTASNKNAVATFPATSHVRFSFVAKTPANSAYQGLRVTLHVAGNTSIANAPVSLLFDKGNLKALNGAANVTLQSYAASTEYAILIDADCAARTFTVAVDGNLYNNNGAGYAFTGTTNSATVDRIILGNGGGLSGEFSFIDAVSVEDAASSTGNGLAIASPAPYQLFQRDGNNQAQIAISGSFTGNPTAIEARWNGGAWQTIDAQPAGGTYSGTLTGGIGQGALEVRFVNDQLILKSVLFVGVGDIYVIAGQSNASGHGAANNEASDPLFVPVMLGNDDVWKVTTDPTDDATGQIDSVSADTNAAGSVWPLVQRQIMQFNRVPVCIIPCAKGATSITQWQPATNHTNPQTLYGSMMRRIQLAGGVRGILWWQGESDAQTNMSQATYANYLNAFADSVFADCGAWVMPCKLQYCTNINPAAQVTINAAIADVWANNPHARRGPDLSYIPTDDVSGKHLEGAQALAWAADKWSFALSAVN